MQDFDHKTSSGTKKVTPLPHLASLSILSASVVTATPPLLQLVDWCWLWCYEWGSLNTCMLWPYRHGWGITQLGASTCRYTELQTACFINIPTDILSATCVKYSYFLYKSLLCNLFNCLTINIVIITYHCIYTIKGLPFLSLSLQ